MALPTRGQVYSLFLQIVDDPGAATFTDAPNVATGALSVFQAGFAQAFDILFNNALNQQVPRVELVVDGIIVPPSPVPFSLSPAEMGFEDFADWEWIAERQAGSNEKFRDLWDEDRLSQRAPTDRLLETVYQNGAFQFVGCTTVRELQIKYVSSAIAPTDNAAIIGFDNSLNFLANYAAGRMAPNKGYDEIGARAMNFAVGAKFNTTGDIGGELFRLMQPLVRSRQNVQVAHKPYQTSRRAWATGQRIPYVAAQQGTTGGSSQNVPMEFSSTANPPTIIGAIDGTNTVFWLTLAVLGFSLYRNGVLQTPGLDYTPLNNQITFQPGSVPQLGDILVAEAYPRYQ